MTKEVTLEIQIRSTESNDARRSLQPPERTRNNQNYGASFDCGYTSLPSIWNAAQMQQLLVRFFVLAAV